MIAIRRVERWLTGGRADERWRAHYELFHTQPTCPEYDKVVTVDEAADFVAAARKKAEAQSV